MKFYRFSDVPMQSDDQVFKASVTIAWIWFILYLGIGTAFVLIYGLVIPRGYFFYGGATIFGLLAWAAWRQLCARLKPTNWVLRCNNHGIIINYRSFQNWDFSAEDIQAVGFDYPEVADVRMVKERRPVSSLGGEQSLQDFTYLDFRLANADTSVLEAYLQAEQKAEHPGKWIIRDYPVEVLPGGIVRLRWKSDLSYGIHPSSGKAIEWLSRHIKIAAAVFTKVNLTSQSNLSPDDGDAEIIKLVKRGDKIGAVKLTRQVYGSTLTEAVAYVEKLQSDG